MGRCVNADALADSKKRGKKIVFIIMIRVRVEKLESFEMLISFFCFWTGPDSIESFRDVDCPIVDC